MPTRIYHVRNNETGKEQLVDATLPAQVLRHVAASLFTIQPVKQADLVRLLTQPQPLQVEKASESKDDSDNSGAQGNDTQAGATGADATSGSTEGVAQGGDDASASLGEGVVQPEEQPQESFQADAGTEAATTGKRRR